MKLKKILAVTAATALLLTSVFTMTSCGDKAADDAYTIGICQLVEHPALDQATEGFKAALTEKLGDKVTFDEQNAQGEQTNCTTITNKFVSDGVDLIMANATNAVKAAREATSDIPIVGTSVTDYVSSGLIESDEAPGANVTGASDLNPVGVQVELMKTLCPDVKTVGIVYCSAEENSAIQADEAKKAFEREGFTVKIYTFADSNEIQTVVTKACTEVDGFYEPTDNVIAANATAMSNITNAQGKPVIGSEESIVAEGGFLATYSINYYDLGYQAGLQAYEILVKAADPGATPIFHFDTSTLSLVINDTTVETLGITVPDELKAE